MKSYVFLTKNSLEIQKTMATQAKTKTIYLLNLKINKYYEKNSNANLPLPLRERERRFEIFLRTRIEKRENAERENAT